MDLIETYNRQACHETANYQYGDNTYNDDIGYDQYYETVYSDMN